MKNKILIINPGGYFFYTFPEERFWKREENFRASLLILYSYLKQRNIQSEVVDFEFEIGRPTCPEEVDHFNHMVRQKLGRYCFDIVAISCYTSMNYLASVSVARICKEINPHCTVVVGGTHATAVPEDFLVEGLFDFVVRGEGEIALHEICMGVHGYKNENPKILQGTPLDLSRGVFLDWEGCPYTQRAIDRIGLSLSRGCPFHCSFCSESLNKMPPRSYPVDLAVRDIKRAADIMNPKYLHIYDPLYRVDMPWGQEILSRLVKENFEKAFYIFTRVDLLNEQQIDLLSKLNVHIWLGVETCSEKMLLAMNKTTNPKKYLSKVEENLAYINERSILCDWGLIFNHPGETQETVDETFSFLERVFSKQKQISIDFLPHDYYYLPGTLDSQSLDYFGREFGAMVRHQEWWKMWGDQSFFAKDIIPSRDLTEKVKWEDRFDEFWHRMILPKISKKTLLFRVWESDILTPSQPLEIAEKTCEHA